MAPAREGLGPVGRWPLAALPEGEQRARGAGSGPGPAPQRQLLGLGYRLSPAFQVAASGAY